VREVGDIHRRQVLNHRDEAASGHLAEDLVDADREVPGLFNARQAQDRGLVRSGQAAGHHGPLLAGHAPRLLIHRRHQSALFPVAFSFPGHDAAPKDHRISGFRRFARSSAVTAACVEAARCGHSCRSSVLIC
jgi:hypothetical protein